MGANGFHARVRYPLHLFDNLNQPLPDPAEAEAAANAFPDRFPDMSSKTGLTQAQSRYLGRIASIAGIASLLAPEGVITACGIAGLVVFSLIVIYRLGLVMFGQSRVYLLTNPASISLLLPVYTILIALKDEAASMPQLSQGLMSLEYPRRLLDIKLLTEADDETTRDAIHEQIWPEGTELIVLPPGRPQTKPRALNYGLARARGAFVTVYDAEDRPNPGQLLDAARRFAWDPNLACVQAPLSGDLRGSGWLARQWALEYAIQFNRALPALARLGLPIALGGTSNHFRRSELVASGAWDAWNVTEDADLGLRFARQGRKVGVIAPSTVEAPPQALSVWIGQRSRWLKGFVQTWLVLMRHPADAISQMGLLSFLSVQLTLGATILSALVHLPWVLWCLVCLISPDVAFGELNWAIFALTYAAGIGTALAATRNSFPLSLRDLLLLPVYWPLQSVAMSRAIYSLLRHPHYWVKTPHD